MATGALLDDADHAKLSAAVDRGPSCWIPATAPEQSRPETMLFACLGTDGAPAEQTTRVIWLPYAHGPVSGARTVTVNATNAASRDDRNLGRGRAPWLSRNAAASP